jgi:hypothetical protein
MRAGIVVNFTLDDRCRLEAIVGDRNAPQKHVWRAKIIHRFLPRVPAGQSRNDCSCLGSGPVRTSTLFGVNVAIKWGNSRLDGDFRL